jgi:hypothetical protein
MIESALWVPLETYWIHNGYIAINGYQNQGST